jgi:cytochrome c553
MAFIRLNSWVLASGLGLLAPGLALAQSPQARASANVDLVARLQEVSDSPRLTEQMLKVGRSVAAVCANCHGEGGNSLKPDIPNLAGQNPSYLLEQIRKFSIGLRRNEFMEGMIKALTADEKIGMVVFYSSQKVNVNTVQAPAALLASGKKIFTEVCWRCHGLDGRGNDKIARIAGQQVPYLMSTIKRYRAGTGRIDPLMMANTRNLTDIDVQAVATYISRME